MYQALYRKYRPKTFDEVVGQEHITNTIKAEIDSGRVSHAYLFTGSRGTGKTSCSKIIAKAVNCPNAKDGNPCGVCEICEGIDSGALLDVVEMDAASNNGVNDVRQLREEAGFTPAQLKYRVYIIDEVHMLSQAAFNALLKTLEEPPKHVIFILATTEIHKVPATIISRCQRFDFKRINSEIIANRIMEIAAMDDFIIDKDAAVLIARLAEGGMRDSLSIADVCRSYSSHVDVQCVTKAVGLSVRSQLIEIAEYVLEGDACKAIEVVSAINEGTGDYKRILVQLSEHYRNLMISKAAKNMSKLVVCMPEDEEKILDQAKRYRMSKILYCLEVLTTALNQAVSQPKVATEMAIIKMSDSSLDTRPSAILEKVNRLEERLNSGDIKISSSETKKLDEIKKEATNTEHNAPKTSEGMYAEKPVYDVKDVVIFKKWPNVLEKLKVKNPALHGTLLKSKAFIYEDIILIDSENKLFLELIRDNDYAKKSLRESIGVVTGQRFRLGPYKKEKYRTVAESEGADPLDELAHKAEMLGVDVNIK